MIRSTQSRLWSNDQIRELAAKIDGCKRVVNVSGWRDLDKEGGRYRDYFKSNIEYRVTNYPGDTEKGFSSDADIALDLSKNVPDELVGRFDLALNHTVLEHLRNPEFGFKQISKLTSDLIITVIPWKQVLHFSPGNYGDYFRISPMVMREWHRENGFEILYEGYQPEYAPETYLIYLGSRHPERYSGFSIIEDLVCLHGKVGRNRIIADLGGIFLRLALKVYRRINKKITLTR